MSSWKTMSLQYGILCGANTSGITGFVEKIRQGEPVLAALIRSGAPKSAQAFVGQTWSILGSDSPHRIAAAFAIGREEIIPEMFQIVIRNIQRRFPEEMSRLSYYLDRHIHVDRERHVPMARRMVEVLCGDDAVRWAQATQTAQTSLQARIRLWDGVRQEIVRMEKICV